MSGRVRVLSRYCTAICPRYDARECVRRNRHEGPHACFSHEWDAAGSWMKANSPDTDTAEEAKRI